MSEYDEMRILTPRTMESTVIEPFLEDYPDALVVEDSASIDEVIRDYMSENGEYGTTCFYDCSSILHQYNTWIKIFNSIKPFYAIKCNPHSAMMDLLSRIPNISFDCGNQIEMEECIQRGISPHNLVCCNPIKTVECMEYMRQMGIWGCVVDCEEEVEKMNEVFGADGRKCQVIIRLEVWTGNRTPKYGCGMEEVEDVLKLCKKYDMKVVGVSFHVGSACSDLSVYENAIADCKEVFDYAESMGYHMTILDLGGGWSGDLSEDGMINDELEKFKKVIYNSMVKNGFVEANKEGQLLYKEKYSDLLVIAEPGRYFNHSTIHICSTVINVSSRNGVYVNKLNEGVMGAFKDLSLRGTRFLPKIQHIPTSGSDVSEEDADNPDNEEMVDTIFMGPSGSKKDIICRQPFAKLLVGDFVLFEDAGAYTTSISSDLIRKQMHFVYIVRSSSFV